MVLGNLWSIAGYFRSLRDSRPTGTEMGELVVVSLQGMRERTARIGRNLMLGSSSKLGN